MSSAVPATISTTAAARTDWDALVVGAGPAGSIAARELARRGARVLLADKSSFPRRKVCGCCLNGLALHILESSGLRQMVDELGGLPLEKLSVWVKRRHASITLPAGLVLSREALDAALIERAVRAGSEFLPATPVMVGGLDETYRHSTGNSEEGRFSLRARVVLVADGLGGRSCAFQEDFRVATANGSRIGAGTVAASAPAYFAAGEIYMACGQHGYVGLVRLEDGRLDIAAALDLEWTRELGGPGLAAESIISEAGLPAIYKLAKLPWTGTAKLTRWRQRLAGDRLFFIGDAAAYAEPFTGEGIAWAFRSAQAVAPLAMQGIGQWQGSLSADWNQLHGRLIGQRQRRSRLVALLLRHGRLTELTTRLLAQVPVLANPLVEYLNRP